MVFRCFGDIEPTWSNLMIFYRVVQKWATPKGIYYDILLSSWGVFEDLENIPEKDGKLDIPTVEPWSFSPNTSYTFFTQRLSWCYKVLWHDVYSIPFRFHKVSFVPHLTRSASPLSVIRTVNHHFRCRVKHQSKGNLFQHSLYFLCQHPVQPLMATWRPNSDV